jgi:hypothetical protein
VLYRSVVLLLAFLSGCSFLIDTTGFVHGGGTDAGRDGRASSAADADADQDQGGAGDEDAGGPGPDAPDAQPDGPGPGHDSGTEAQAPLFTLDPNQVACGGSHCTSNSGFCCRNSTSCETNSQNCSSSELRCDETADCPSAQVCCARKDQYNPSVISSFCTSSCGAGETRICKSKSECSNCAVATCAGRTMGLCGTPPAECSN